MTLRTIVQVIAAIRRLTQAIERWAGRGWGVVAHSDHGMAPTRADEGLVAAWNRLVGEPWHRHPPGGAGRVRWCHPRPDATTRVHRELVAALDGRLLVATPDEPQARGLTTNSAAYRARLGDVLVIATDEIVVAPQAPPFDHGGVSADEMLVPIAIWQPR